MTHSNSSLNVIYFFDAIRKNNFLLIFILLENCFAKRRKKELLIDLSEINVPNTTSRQISNDSRNTLLKNYCLSDHAER